MRKDITINSQEELLTIKFTDFKTLCKDSTVKQCESYRDYLISVRPNPKTMGQAMDSFFGKVDQRLRYVNKLLNGEIFG